MYILQQATSASRRAWFQNMRERVAALHLPLEGERRNEYYGLVWEKSLNGATFIVMKYHFDDDRINCWITKRRSGCLEYEWNDFDGDWVCVSRVA